MSHTPGPWESEDNVVYALMDDEWLGKPHQCNRITIGISFDRRVPQEERKATIDMVTACPDLLAALPDPFVMRVLADWLFELRETGQLDWPEKITKSLPDTVMKWADVIEAAKAKAEGR